MAPDLAARLVARSKKIGLVFARPDGTPLTGDLARVALDRIGKRANLRHFGWHVTRHTFASHLVGAGVPIRTVQELLGHSDLKMTMRYAHVAPAAMYEAVNVLPLLENNPNERFGQQAVNTSKFPALQTPSGETMDVLISANFAKENAPR